MQTKSVVDEIIEEVANKFLGIETLEERKRDSLDFHDIHVACLREALLEAFDAGYKMCAVSRG